MNSVESRVIKIAADTLKVKETDVTLNSHLVDDLGADSLYQVELIMAFEAEFGCEISDEDASKIATIRDAVNYIEQKVKIS
jgi:acyl carrier protein